MLQFRGMELSGIGRRAGTPDRHWARLSMDFQEGEDGPVRTVAVDLLVPKSLDATWRELQESARSEAIAILEAALLTLGGSSLDQLDVETLRIEDAD